MPPTPQHHYPPSPPHTQTQAYTSTGPIPMGISAWRCPPIGSPLGATQALHWDEAGGPCPSKGPQMKSLHSQGRREVPAPQSHRILGTHTAPAFGQIPSTSQERKLRLDQDSWLVPGSLSSPRLCPPGAGQPHLPITSDLFPPELPVPSY